MPYDRGNDVGYVATVQVGTPPRDFSILMDSGSADFWIGGENCQSQAGGDCVRDFIPAYPIAILSDVSLPFRVLTFFLANNPQPVSKTPGTPSRLHTVPVKSRGTSSLIMSTLLAWLWINIPLALLLWNLQTSRTILPSSMV